MSDKYKNIDDLFRDRFENFEKDPPDHVWENVKAGINTGGGPKGGFKGGMAGFTALLIIIGTILIYLLSNSFTVNTPETQTAQTARSENDPTIAATGLQRPADADQNLQRQEITNTQEFPSASQNDRFIQDQKTEIQTTTAHARVKTIPENKIGRNTLIASNPAEKNKIPSSATTVSQQHELSNLNYISFEEVGLKAQNKNFLAGKKASSEVSTVPIAPPEDYAPKGEWLLGIYFRPEMIKYPADNNITNYARGLDLLLTYKKQNYFIQTGLGLSRVKDAGNYHIDYNKFVGSYEDVYDVTFDTVNNQVVPVYHTQTVNVYDSINYVRITPSERIYTYLDLPVLFGYGQEYRRLGWFIKAGPALSLKIHENIPAMDMTGDQFKILSVENSLPARIKANWQFAMSAGVTYKLGNRISLSVEPTMRYYINSDYEPGKFTTKHPYSVGLRTGLLLSF